MRLIPGGSSGTFATFVMVAAAAASTGARPFVPRYQSRGCGAHRGCAVRPTTDSPPPCRGPGPASSNQSRADDPGVRIVIGESIAGETTHDATVRRCQAGRISGRSAIAPRSQRGQPKTVDLVCAEGSCGRPFQRGELLSERDILKNQLVMSTGRHSQRRAEQTEAFPARGDAVAVRDAESTVTGTTPILAKDISREPH